MEKTEFIPKQIDIEVTTKCNLRCKYCPSVDGTLPTGHMDLDYFKSIIDRVNFETAIVCWLNGEPLLHPNYYEMVKYVTDRNHKMYITTNGTIWNDDLFEHITNDTSCYQIIFSLDGLPDSKSKSIEIARPGSNRETIVKNIERFRELKIKKNSKLDMAIKICDRGQDYQEFEAFIEYWLTKEGISYVCLGKPLVQENDKSMRIYPCQYSDHNFMVIRWDGVLARCSYNEKASFEGANFGKLDMTTPLLEVYNNELYTKFRENQRNGIFTGPCISCGYAYTGHGWKGQIQSRNEAGELYGKTIYYRQDYYNQFFSLVDRGKPDAYYKMKS
jgi:sulfatase maturation enzyme AslB (radical SAM superfamily)